MQKNNRRGFTLIELIIVIAIIALLAAATFVAVDPAKRIGDANNAQRWADVTAIADAWQKYTVDNSGTYPSSTIGTLTYNINPVGQEGNGTLCGSGSTGSTTNAYVDLSVLITDGYLGAIPTDPDSTNHDTDETGYYLWRTGAGALVVGACDPYNNATITVTR